ncbi:hypothetical protein AVEN_105177-1 [Araneus ventricosus]|uniref:Uncharacterized protein n=1 Tax=Araneus ventricosus TaxID=182803 RepID=A0A4Y2INM8_ARAVE|nr:hypothetical protein AVEN_105177-1 [Araneus ventricosus]
MASPQKQAQVVAWLIEFKSATQRADMSFSDNKEGGRNECVTVRQRQADGGGDCSNPQSSGSGDMEIKDGRSSRKRLY